MAAGALARFLPGRTGLHALALPSAFTSRCRHAYAAVALLGLAPIAHMIDRPLLAFCCVGAGCALMIGAVVADRRLRSAVEALALAVALATFAATAEFIPAWPPPRTAAAVAMLAAAAIAVEAARRAGASRRDAALPFLLLTALLAAAGYVHLVSRSWLPLVTGLAHAGSDTFGYMALSAAHVGYALFGIALVFALLVRCFVRGAPCRATLLVAADRWRLIAVGGAAFLAMLQTGH